MCSSLTLSQSCLTEVAQIRVLEHIRSSYPERANTKSYLSVEIYQNVFLSECKARQDDVIDYLKKRIAFTGPQSIESMCESCS